MTTSTTFRIGGELDVRRLGFGAMRLPSGPGPARETSSRWPGGPSSWVSP